MNETYQPRPPEAESLPVGRAIAVGVGALITFAIGMAVAWAMWRAWGHEGSLGEPMGRPQIGAVYQRPFALETGAKDLRSRQREHLSTYGWADRSTGLAHVPIDVAIDKLIRQEQHRAEPVR
jgi:hypothetical protein